MTHTTRRSSTLRQALLALVLTPLAGCGRNHGPIDVLLDGGTTDLAPCQGSGCPVKVGKAVLVATPAAGAIAGGLSLGTSGDGKSLVASWSETQNGASLVKVAASGDGAASFSAAAPLATPTDATLSAPRVLVTSGGVLIAAVASVPDANAKDPPHSSLRLYRSIDGGMSFQPRADLKSTFGDRTFVDAAFTGSPDGVALVTAWMDSTPASRLAAGAPPGSALLASTSSDGGATFVAPQVVSTTPFTPAAHFGAFVRGMVVGLSPALAKTSPAFPAPVGTAVLALGSFGGSFGAPHEVVGSGYGVLPTTAAPAVAAGPDGAVHVVWWSTETLGLWHVVSHDGGTSFGAPMAILTTTQPTPGDISLVVDGAGVAWVATVDAGAVRLVRIAADGTLSEITEAQATLAATASSPYADSRFAGSYALAPLPDTGVILGWIDAGLTGDMNGAPSLQARRIAP